MATYQFNVVKSILQKSIFDENVIHIILTAYWKNLKNKYKDLVDWINIDKLNWEQLSSNPNAIYLLEIRNEFENCLSIKAYNNLRDKICWDNLSLNPNAIELLTNNKDKLDKKALLFLFGHGLITFFKNEDDIDKIWDLINNDEYNNKDVEKLLIYWGDLSKNPNAIELLTNNQDKICWYELTKNPNAIDLLKNNQDKIYWDNLCLNPNAIELLTNNQDKIDWDNLCLNPNAIDLLKENQDEIDWYYLSSNPSIFEDEPMPII
jgi:hypothetical protein